MGEPVLLPPVTVSIGRSNAIASLSEGFSNGSFRLLILPGKLQCPLSVITARRARSERIGAENIRKEVSTLRASTRELGIIVAER